MSIKEEGMIPIRETIKELQNSKSIDEIDDKNEHDNEDDMIEEEK